MSDAPSSDPLSCFLELSATVLGALPSTLARTAAAAVADLPATRRDWESREQPAARHFAAACALAPDVTRPLVNAAAALEGRFQWRDGAAHGFGNRKRGDLAYVEFAGPTGLVPTDDLRLGIFLLAPGAFYPNHSHAADEIYYVIAGAGEWQVDGGAFTAHGPGNLIEMPSFTPHALRTGTRPALMVYAWTGDLAGEYRVL